MRKSREQPNRQLLEQAGNRADIPGRVDVTYVIGTTTVPAKESIRRPPSTRFRRATTARATVTKPEHGQEECNRAPRVRAASERAFSGAKNHP